MITLVLGGARSGKSSYAEKAADQWLDGTPKGERVYLATAQAFDEEMSKRVEAHKTRRGKNWRTIEEPLQLTQTLTREMAEKRLILVDCLTLWLSNLMLSDAEVNREIDGLCEFLKNATGDFLIVSNEVGNGIVPENKLAREFRDIQGIANQRIAEITDKAVLITAGLPLVLKG